DVQSLFCEMLWMSKWDCSRKTNRSSMRLTSMGVPYAFIPCAAVPRSDPGWHFTRGPRCAWSRMGAATIADSTTPGIADAPGELQDPIESQNCSASPYGRRRSRRSREYGRGTKDGHPGGFPHCVLHPGREYNCHRA